MADSPSPPRRSKRSTAGKRQRHFRVSELTPKWRRVYLDMDHCRLQKCIQTVQTATSVEIDQLRQIGKTFVAMAISAASAYGASREDLLLEYARAVTSRGLAANDSHEHSMAQHGNTAVALAAYHGYVQLLDYLLGLGSSLDSHGMYGNAIEAALRNGQHAAQELLLRERPSDAASFFAKDGFSLALRRAIYKNNVEGVRLLITRGPSLLCQPTMCDRHYKSMRDRGRHKTHLWPMLRQLYPNVSSVEHWSPPLHWSFPTADRHAINLLWHHHAMQSGQYLKGQQQQQQRQQQPQPVLPKEVRLQIFSFTGRGWFKSDGNRGMTKLG
mmetsp:Transcript_6110/g.17170  ORF Transcript_6110/g.17170 Transcript_6110/m.17170 type:complete len:327 (-) Transcript_6110:114-1094(-)